MNYQNDLIDPEQASQIPNDIRDLDPVHARALIEDKHWTPGKLLQNIENASAGEITSWLKEHGLYEAADDNRPPLSPTSLASKLDTHDSIDDALCAHDIDRTGTSGRDGGADA